MMGDSANVDSPDSPLYFISTQIQSRHEDREQKDGKLSILQSFKNVPDSPKMKAPKPAKVTKNKRKTTKKPRRQINSISAFVKETLGGNRDSDAQSLLDEFMGDQKKLDDFLTEVEKVTATPHLLSKKVKTRNSVLFTGPEWTEFLEKIRLKFPNLSSGNRKSLKVISKHLRDIKQTEIEQSTSQELSSMWSQASRQPSNDLSTEDLIWLYDLDEEQLKSETSQYQHEESLHNSPCLTLSQAVDDPSHRDGFNLFSPVDRNESLEGGRPLSQSPPNLFSTQEPMSVSLHSTHTHSPLLQETQDLLDEVILGSESEPEPLTESEVQLYCFQSDSKEESLHSALLFGQKLSARHSRNTQLASATTSLIFASTLKLLRGPSQDSKLQPAFEESPLGKKEDGNRTIMSSATPNKDSYMHGVHTPSCLRIDSSPISQKQRIDSSPFLAKGRTSKSKLFTQESTGAEDEIFLSANTQFPEDGVHLLDHSDTESFQFSPLKRIQKVVKHDRIEVSGKVELDPRKSSCVQLAILPLERELTEDIIPDSEEDDAELSIIEITKEDWVSNSEVAANNTSVLQVPSSPELIQN